MLLSSFPESPAFESLLSGSHNVDLLAVLGEVGGCDLRAVENWILQTASAAFCVSATHQHPELHGLVTKFAGLQIDEMILDGRVARTTATGRGWSLAVATLEHRLLSEVGVDSDLVTILDEVFLRIEGPEGLLFHPAGCYSVWVDACVATGFLVEKFGCEAVDLRPVLTEGRLRNSDRRAFVSRYLKSVCDSQLLADDAVAVAVSQLAALNPGETARWLELVRAELQSGRASVAFQLASRLERSGCTAAAPLRREAETALAFLN